MPIVLPPRAVRTSYDRLARANADRMPPLFFANRNLAALRDAAAAPADLRRVRVKDAEKFIGRFA